MGFSNWRDAQIGRSSSEPGRDVRAWEVAIIEMERSELGTSPRKHLLLFSEFIFVVSEEIISGP